MELLLYMKRVQQKYKIMQSINSIKKIKKKNFYVFNFIKFGQNDIKLKLNQTFQWYLARLS